MTDTKRKMSNTDFQLKGLVSQRKQLFDSSEKLVDNGKDDHSSGQLKKSDISVSVLVNRAPDGDQTESSVNSPTMHVSGVKEKLQAFEGIESKNSKSP